MEAPLDAPGGRPPRLKKILLWLLAGFALLVAGLALFVMLFDFSGYIQSSLGHGSGREVTMDGDVDIDWGWRPKLTAHNVRIGNMEGAQEPLMASADTVIVSLDARQLLRGRVVLPELILEKPNIALEKDEKGNANWHFTDNPEGKAIDAVTPDNRAEIPAIGRLIIRDGRLHYIDLQNKIDIETELSTATGTLEREEIVIKGRGTHQGKPFQLDFTGGSVLTLQDTNEPYPLKADATIGATTAHIEGTVIDPLQLKGLDLQMQVAGHDMADLFAITGIALPSSPPYKLKGHLGMDGKVWKFTDFAGTMGSSDLEGDLSWDTTNLKRPLLTAKVTSKLLDYADLAGLIGAKPEQQTNDGRVLPDVPLDISRMAAMDAKVEFTGKRIKSRGLPLDDFFMKLDLDRLLLKVAPVKFGTANGDILADITVNARSEPVSINTDVQFRRLSLERLMHATETKLNATPAQGYIGGTAKLKGNGKSLRDMLANAHGNIGLGMEGGQLSNLVVELLGLDLAESLGLIAKGDHPVKIRCVIGDFAVREGVMHSNTIIADTSDTKIVGKGTVNLKTEGLDIKLEAHPKDASPLSFKTPITVKGTLGKPDLGLAAEQLAARGGIAAALGAIIPPAAVLAFIEPGLGKDGDCATLIADMNRHTGKSRGENLIPKNK